MVNEGTLNRLTFSVGTAGNNIASCLINKEQENIIALLGDSVTKHNNTGNVYTNGLQVFNQNKQIICQQVRNFFEKTTANKLDEINIINSMAGGLGSSVPFELINLLTEEFGFNKSLYSNGLLWGNNHSILEAYNQLLYISDIHEKVDFITCYDNSFSSNINGLIGQCSSEQLGFEAVNDEISDNLINSFLGRSERLIDLQAYDGSLKFYIPSASNSEIRLFHKQAQLFGLNGNFKRSTVYYANLIYTDSVDKMMLFDVNKLAYSNSSMKMCSFVQQDNDSKHYLVSNNSNIIDSLENLIFNFNKFFEKGAFLQYYLDSVGKDEFLERKEVILNIIQNYKKL